VISKDIRNLLSLEAVLSFFIIENCIITDRKLQSRVRDPYYRYFYYDRSYKHNCYFYTESRVVTSNDTLLHKQHEVLFTTSSIPCGREEGRFSFTVFLV